MINNLIKYRLTHQSFLLMYSGGLDSSVLLHQLVFIHNKYKNLLKSLRVLHVNHKINQHADLWSQHCKIECKQYNIKLITKKIKKKIPIKSNTEAIARNERLKIIKKILKPKEIIITAHHLNDQCETFLLALKRGSGINGLSAIKEYSSILNTIIIRPLLKIPRSLLHSFAIKKKIKWITDLSNHDLHYDRNYIRHIIIPKMEKRWPEFIQKCYITSKLCTTSVQVIEYFIKKIYKKYINTDYSLNINFIIKYNQEIHFLILRKWFFLHVKRMPSYNILSKLYYEVIQNKKKINPIMNFQNFQIKKYKNNIYFFKKEPDTKSIIIKWNRPFKPIKLPLKIGYICQNKINKNAINAINQPNYNEKVTIRFHYTGKILQPGRSFATTIKKIWQSMHIPPWKRNNIPLLFYNNQFVGAIGLFFDTYYINNQSIHKKWKIIWFNKIDY
ncbi:tRNA(Ile)-lysidine synthase [Buchnera aphidicola (Thelaxes suberi)]